MSKSIYVLSVALLADLAGAQNAQLKAIQDKVFAARKTGNAATMVAANVSAREQVAKLIEGNQLSTGAEFLQAARSYPTSGELKDQEVHYELLLSALIMGERDARKDIMAGWDEVQVATSRPRPFGVEKILGSEGNTGKYRIEPTAKCIRDALADPEGFSKSHGDKDNADIKALVDADQAARQVDFSKLTPEELVKIERTDLDRQHKIRELIEKGAPNTAADFESCALVLQHGEDWNDYRFAHELCLAAIALGSKELAPWLAGASYDRMLRRASYPQRFCTQYFNEDLSSGYKLSEYSCYGICDAERKAVVHASLAEALARAKTLGN